MLHEHRDIISKMKIDDTHFARIFEKHNDLDNKILKSDYLSDIEMEKLKKEKLKLKDEAYNIILKYKKENNL